MHPQKKIPRYRHGYKFFNSAVKSRAHGKQNIPKQIVPFSKLCP